MRMADLKPGWVVVGNDGHRVGSIRDVGQNYLLASTGGLSANIYIPASAIGNVEHQTVHLNVPQRDVAGMGWEEPPREEDAPVTSPEADLHRHV